MAKYRPEPIHIELGSLIRGSREEGFFIPEDEFNILLESYLGVKFYTCGNPNCHARLRYNVREDKPLKFCTKCGSEIDWTQPTTRIQKVMICPMCLKEYQSDEKYCSIDGMRLEQHDVLL
jgi:hypothetical protein